jgi:hypothetical protein
MCDISKDFEAGHRMQVFREEVHRVLRYYNLPMCGVEESTRMRRTWALALQRRWLIRVNRDVLWDSRVTVPWMIDMARHEVAHLVAWRIFMEGGHGSEFRRVCRVLDCNPSWRDIEDGPLGYAAWERQVSLRRRNGRICGGIQRALRGVGALLRETGSKSGL